ncbi:MAG: efflux RND transporter periplasmic adaptor subunit [Chloroflexi bacterium]|nr:efflux RND transporter periplasmic adaptor subunit [Chloroflexota bacterium]
MRRTHLSFFTLILLAGLILVAACTPGELAASEEATPTPLPTPAQASKPTYIVQQGDILAQVKFSARVMPAVEEALFFRADGRVRNVYVRSGDEVTEGQVLADLVSLDYMEAQARQQELTLRRAEINLEMAWLRQQLSATQTPSYVQGYDIRMKMDELEVELAEIALEETKLNAQSLDTAISDAQIISPINGKVLNVNVLEGSEVRAFAPLITVGDDSQLEVGATLSSTQMQDLAEGMEVIVELPNRPGEKLTGKIRSLPYPYGTGGGKSSTTASGGGATGSAQVDNTTRIQLDNSDAIRGFRLGDLVDVTVILESKENVLWLPPQAIRSFEGRNFVVVETDALPRRVDVRLGIQNEEKVEILEGLEAGQKVIGP